MDPRLRDNQASWNERVGIHARSRFYDVEGWLRHSFGPPARELGVLGDVKGLSLLHLQCHFGMDTLNWARAGATVTGVDFSPAAIAQATSLAERAGVADRATSVCANVYDAPEALSHQRFDVVYVSLGSLCWLPDVEQWGEVVAELLGPGGRLYLHDVHPFSSCLDDEGDRVIYGYFEDSDHPYVDDGEYTYTDGEKLIATRTYEWNHALSEVLASLQRRDLDIDFLGEHDWTVFRQFPWLEEREPGLFVTPDGRAKIPLTFTLLAHARA